jgi:RNA polymerase sigma-70 factor (ECF subfamily)
VLLKDLFEMSLSEIADVLQTTVGAVKSALHRGRERLREPEAGSASRRRLVSAAVVDRFVELFNASDMDGLRELVLDTAAVANAGPGNPYGGEPPRTRDVFFSAMEDGHPKWPSLFTPKSSRAIRADLEGEPIVLVRVPSDRLAELTGVPGEALETVFRLEEDDGHVCRLIAYTRSIPRSCAR